MSVCVRFHALMTSTPFMTTRRDLNFMEQALVVYGGRILPNEYANKKRHALVFGKWIELATPTWHGVENGSHVTIGAETFYFGGYHCGNYGTHEEKVYAYNFKTDYWRIASHAPFAHEAMNCALYDGKVVLAGGGTHSAVDDAWIFNPTKVVIAPDQIDEDYYRMLHVRYGHVGEGKPDGYPNADDFIVEGTEKEEADFWAKRGWTKLPDMPFAVCAAETFVIGKRMYVVGGFGDDGKTWPKKPTDEDEGDGEEGEDGLFYCDRKNQKVGWVQELDLTTNEWRLLDYAPTPIAAEDDVAPFTDEARAKFETMGLGDRKWGTGIFGKVPYNGGTAVIGDCGNMAFVKADGSVDAFMPSLKDMLQPSVARGLEFANLKTIDLRPDFSIVRRQASHIAALL